MAEAGNVENIRKGKNAGVSTTKLKAIVKEIRILKGRMDSIRGDLGQEFKQAEDDHEVNRQMLKWAIKLITQEVTTGQQNFRDLTDYCEKLGLFDQGDLLEDETA